MTGQSKNVHAARMVCAEIRDGVAVRACVWDHVPGKALLPEVCAPHAVCARQIAHDEPLQAQADIHLVPALPGRLCDGPDGAVPDLLPGGIWIEIRKAHTEHSFDVSSMGFLLFSCASVMHQFCSNKYAAIQPRISSFGVVPLDLAAALNLSAISRLSLQEITDMFSASHLLRARRWVSVGIAYLPRADVRRIQRGRNQRFGVHAQNAGDGPQNAQDILRGVNGRIVHCAVGKLPAEAVSRHGKIHAAAKIAAGRVVGLDGDKLAVKIDDDTAGKLPVTSAIICSVRVIVGICLRSPRGNDIKHVCHPPIFLSCLFCFVSMAALYTVIPYMSRAFQKFLYKK
nr:MAG TPA: hypothetical protein [Caudoviricetes sp.]